MQVSSAGLIILLVLSLSRVYAKGDTRFYSMALYNRYMKSRNTFSSFLLLLSIFYINQIEHLKKLSRSVLLPLLHEREVYFMYVRSFSYRLSPETIKFPTLKDPMTELALLSMWEFIFQCNGRAEGDACIHLTSKYNCISLSQLIILVYIKKRSDLELHE